MSTTDQTASNRQKQVEDKAKETVKGYKPKTGKAFDAARGYVEAQFEIAFEVQERYVGILEERGVSRDQLRSLYTQGLLTQEEAVEAFVLFPERSDSKRSGTSASAPANGQS